MTRYVWSKRYSRWVKWKKPARQERWPFERPTRWSEPTPEMLARRARLLADNVSRNNSILNRLRELRPLGEWSSGASIVQRIEREMHMESAP